MQPLSIQAAMRAFSAERLDAYRAPEDADDLDMVARYLWNLALVCALHPPLHALEVTFRNALYTGSLKVLEGRPFQYAEVSCWLDATPSLLMPREQAAVEEAKERLRRRNNPHYLTPGRLVSKLGFGFWTALCHSPYEQSRKDGPALWPTILKHAFIFAPKTARSRPAILYRFEGIRELRNRISHHEPIWDWDLPEWHARILDTLAWMNPGVERAVRQESALEAVFSEGPRAFRAKAEALVRVERPKT